MRKKKTKVTIEEKPTYKRKKRKVTKKIDKPLEKEELKVKKEKSTVVKIIDKEPIKATEKSEFPVIKPVLLDTEKMVVVESLVNATCRIGMHIYNLEIGKRIQILQAHLPILEGEKVKRILR